MGVGGRMRVRVRQAKDASGIQPKTVANERALVSVVVDIAVPAEDLGLELFGVLVPKLGGLAV